ncbi:GTP-binding protein, partial [bacterium]|nr:GTP-binding protein [bacterium]
NVCLVGKPNAGKSSLINKLIGEERLLVSSVPHTTREPQDIAFKHKDKIINFIDTAGISKKGQKSVKQRHAKKALEKLSIVKSLRSLKFADIALLILDISEKLTHQDSKIVEEIVNSKTSLIIVANKWDLIKNRDTKEFTKYIRNELPFVVWAPIQFTSALTGEKVAKLFDVIAETYEQRLTTIKENPLNKFLGRLIKIHKPAKAKGTKRPHIYELKQISSNPPRFMIRIGAKDTINFSYVRFIENRLREKFGFVGAPITIIVEHNLRIHGQHEDREKAKTKKSSKSNSSSSRK